MLRLFRRVVYASAVRFCIPVLVCLLGCGGPAAPTETPPDPLANVTAEELFDQGVEFGRTGDVRRAEQYLLAALERGYARGPVITLLIRLCTTQGRYSAALAYAEPVLADEPNNWSLRRVVASLYHGLDRVEDARIHYHRVLESAPSDATTHYLLGMLYLEDRSDMEQARPLLQRYLELAPDGGHVEEVRSLVERELTPIQRIERMDPRPAPPASEPAVEPPASAPPTAEPPSPDEAEAPAQPEEPST